MIFVFAMSYVSAVSLNSLARTDTKRYLPSWRVLLDTLCTYLYMMKGMGINALGQGENHEIH